MRIVRWAPSERVDIPDITAMSLLVLGEFRRTLRALVTGDASYIVQGFKVEPEAPATTRIRVRLQPPGEPRGAALGGEQTSPGLDYGQLIGDRDSSFLDEGASQQFLDFVGQPVASYVVEMRFVYSDGVNDNRAFWNNGTMSEFVAVSATRHVSAWQIQRVAVASGGQWIPLATVAWDGVAVDAVDITDTRTFLFEGQAPFSRTTQDGAGGVADFSRTTTRGDAAAGAFRVHEVVRALERQIQDIKGANNSGVWDWFSRVYRPYDPAAALPAQRTKNLRSIDTVTYTIGDGTSTFGDFNGTTGLEACLDHLEALAAGNRPEKVEIVVHGGNYDITTPKLILSGTGQPLTVTIRSSQTLSQANGGLFGRPLITINGTGIGASTYAVAISSGTNFGSLVLRGLDVFWSGTTAAGRGMFSANGYIEAYDCNLQMAVSPSSPAVDAGNVLLSSFARKSRVQNCFIRGRVQFYDPGASAVTREDAREGGVIANSRLEETHVALSDRGAGAAPNVAVGFTIIDTVLEGRSSAVYTSSVAMVDARCSSRLNIVNCQLNYGINENCIDGRTYATNDVFRWSIRDCSFFTGINNGTHAPAAGQNGASGTGWAVNVESTTNGAVGVTIEGCRWGLDSTDAGAVRYHNINDSFVHGSTVTFCSHGGGGTDSFQSILVSATSAAWEACVKISDCIVHNWNGNLPRADGIKLVNVNDVSISGCTLRGDQYGAVDITTRTNAHCALTIDDCDDVRVTNTLFARWNYGATTPACLRLPTVSLCERLIVESNQFEGNGNYAIDIVGGGTFTNGPIISGNNIRGGADSDNLGIQLTSTCGLYWSVVGNTFRHNSGAGFDFIFFNNMGGGVVSGNRSNADIRKTGVTLIRGYKPDDVFLTLNQDLNQVGAYT